MFKQILLMAALIVAGGSAWSQEGTPAPKKIYGGQYMTQPQRVEYRSRLFAANSEEERELIRKEHNALMKKRAKARGAILPDDPSDRGGNMLPPIVGMGQI